MKKNPNELFLNMLDAISTYVWYAGHKPDKKVAKLRKIARQANDAANRIEQTEGMNESQSPTHIGADSDTPKTCDEISHGIFTMEPFPYKFCPECGVRFSS